MLVKVNKDKPDKDIIKKAVEILNKGGILVAPTETAYGFICDATNFQAIYKVYSIKRREKNKYLPLAVASLIQLQNFFELNEKELELVGKYPCISIVLKPRIGAQKYDVHLVENQKNCAVRVSTNNLIKNLAKKLGRPLTASSANLAGGGVCYSVPDIKKQIGDLENKVDMILDGGALAIKKPSTIVKVRGDKIKVLRHGETEIL
ncbi:MAG: L-threonylcarbamoyladenylate synthase [Candidatus Kuenenbacteria bacterium]